MTQRVIIAGAGGQLGRELLASALPEVECIGLDRASLDIGDANAVADRIGELQAATVINAAAYTGVDAAEAEHDAAWAGNAHGPRYLARACRDIGTRLIHISTDFVFDGQARTPYLPDSPTAPIGEYGRSKLAGELAVRELLPTALVLRTSWVYSRFGGNFVKTMLRLMAQRDELRVVDDQRGTPTWAGGTAAMLWQAALHPEFAGIHHWSDGGECSWYEFAVAIAEEGEALDLIANPAKISPIPADEYPTPAQRPAYSVLDKRSTLEALGLDEVPWRDQLRTMLQELKESGDA